MATKTFGIKCVIQISQEMITNLFITAFEGGCNYWVHEVKLYDYHATQVDYDEHTNFSDDIKVIHFNYDEESFSSKNLYMYSIQPGLETMAKKCPEHFADIIEDNIDAETADVFIQCCLFGEIVYS